MKVGSVICFKHCCKHTKILAADVPTICPICKKPLDASSFLLPPFVACRTSAASAHNSPQSIVLCLSNSASDEIEKNLHCGITDSQGNVLHYSHLGLVSSSTGWESSLVLKCGRMFESVGHGTCDVDAACWDRRVEDVRMSCVWDASRFVSNDHDCLSFVCSFLECWEPSLSDRVVLSNLITDLVLTPYNKVVTLSRMADAYLKGMGRRLTTEILKLRECISKSDLKELLLKCRADEWITEIAIEKVERVLDRHGRSSAVSEFFKEFECRPSLLPGLCIYLREIGCERAANLIDPELTFMPAPRVVNSTEATSEACGYPVKSENVPIGLFRGQSVEDSSNHEDGHGEETYAIPPPSDDAANSQTPIVHPMKCEVSPPINDGDDNETDNREEQRKLKFQNVLEEMGKEFGKPMHIDGLKDYMRTKISCSEERLEAVKDWPSLINELTECGIDHNKTNYFRNMIEKRLCNSNDRRRLLELLDDYENM